MSRTYSVAQARSHLSLLLGEVERGNAVSITRRGKSVAVVVSPRQYKRLTGGAGGFRALYDAWCVTVDDDDRDLPAGFFRQLRDRSRGREDRP